MAQSIKQLIKNVDNIKSVNGRMKLRKMLEEIEKEILKDIERANF